MNASAERVFYYHADGSPIGGYVTHPFEHVLKTSSSVSLGQAGGHASAREECFQLDGIMRTGAHYSAVTGSTQKGSGNWTTLVTSVVEDLNLLDIVTADRIVSRIALENSRKPGMYYPKVEFVGCQFENLRIAGMPVTPAVDLDLLSAPAPRREAPSSQEGSMLSTDLSTARIEFPDLPWPQVPGFLNRAILQSEEFSLKKGAPAWLTSRFDWISNEQERAKRGYVLASLVNGVHGATPGSSFGHVVQVPGFGNIFLGELIVSPISFHLTMLRVEMGCLAAGNVNIASSRGSTLPMP